MKRAFVILNGILLTTLVVAQDIITTKSGEDISAVVVEVTPESVKYRKYDNQQGPLYTLDKGEIFMIKYENGTKDVFASGDSGTALLSDDGAATIYFYRPKKFASSKTKIIVGTVEPDEVIVAVKNGSWYKANYTHIGDRDFVSGVFTINPESYRFTIEPQNTYYVRCTILTRGFKVMAELEMVDQETAETEMSSLKEQTKNYVD